MKQTDLEFLANTAAEVVELTKMGHAKIRVGGKDYWITEKRPMNPAMLTDLYQFTMMAVYLEAGMENKQATFNAFYRKNPFDGGYAIAVGLEHVLEYLSQLQFTGDDIDHMRKNWKMPDKLWEYLREFEFNGEVKAVAEGAMVQPYMPMVQVTAPLPVANFVETYILNQLGSPTMVATRAFRMYIESGGAPILEFGLRRMPGGIDTALKTTRAAYIGGCVGTSNVLAEQVLGIKASGTMAHSLVMAFDTQYEAFRTYADVFRDQSIFLIDTYGYMNGVQDAVKVSKELGITPKGVRDDSGDLAYQSKVIRKILDENGFQNAKIAVSNDIDERALQSIQREGGKIDIYGIGTKLVNVPSLGIVYKLVEIDGRPVIKLSGNEEKITDPCKKEQVYRIIDERGYYTGDVVLIEGDRLENGMTTYHRSKSYETKRFGDVGKAIPLLHTVNQGRTQTYQPPHLDDIRQNTLSNLKHCWPEMLRVDHPAEYWMGFSQRLHDIKEGLIRQHTIER